MCGCGADKHPVNDPDSTESYEVHGYRVTYPGVHLKLVRRNNNGDVVKNVPLECRRTKQIWFRHLYFTDKNNDNKKFTAHCGWLYEIKQLFTPFEFKDGGTSLLEAKSAMKDHSRVKGEHRRYEFHLKGNTYGGKDGKDLIWGVDWKMSWPGVNMMVRDSNDVLMARIYTSFACPFKHSTVFFYANTDEKRKPIILATATTLKYQTSVFECRNNSGGGDSGGGYNISFGQ